MPDNNSDVQPARQDHQRLSKQRTPAHPVALSNCFSNKVHSALEDALANLFASSPGDPSTATASRHMLVAVSGGPDSTALLAALVSLKADSPLQLSACHVNHHLRGSESDADEAFCKHLCQTWDVPLDVRHLATERPAVSEATLRTARYDLLTEAAYACSAPFIICGHTFDDQVETMLFRLFRGTALAGLIAMEPVRQLASSISLVRPLLSITRLECLEYLHELGVEARHDLSNEQLNYTRNYVRHRVIPVIEERFGSFKTHLGQFRELIVAEERLLKATTDSALQTLQADSGQTSNVWSLTPFQQLPLAIKRRVVARGLEDRAVEVSFQKVASILELVDGLTAQQRLSLNTRWDIKIERKSICWLDKEALIARPGGLADLEQNLKVPGLSIIPPLGYAIRIEPWKPGLSMPDESTAGAWEAVVDLSAATMPLTLRFRRPGDVIRPFGMNQLVKLKKYLHTRKQPLSPFAPGFPTVVIADRQEVVWVPGVGLSNKLRVIGAPSHILSWVKLKDDAIYLV